MMYKSEYSSFLYVLLNQSVLCNCEVEVETYFLEWLAAAKIRNLN